VVAIPRLLAHATLNQVDYWEAPYFIVITMSDGSPLFGNLNGRKIWRCHLSATPIGIRKIGDW